MRSLTRFDVKPWLPVLLLGLLVLWCAALAFSRVWWTGRVTYAFLLWNVGLAVVPYSFAKALAAAERRGWASPALLPLFGAWLLFFPNAPYVLTDLLHLRPKPGAPLWFDLALLLSCGGTSLAFGLLSLLDVQAVVERRLGWVLGWLTAVGSLLLSGFGIYLGRYQRWNSWDIVTKPTALLLDVADRFVHPLHHPRTWGVTVLFGGLLVLAYALIRAVRVAGRPQA